MQYNLSFLNNALELFLDYRSQKMNKVFLKNNCTNYLNLLLQIHKKQEKMIITSRLQQIHLLWIKQGDKILLGII